jgi:phospholipid-binding lipoprotein MlaA
MFEVNRSLDRYVIRPVAQAWDFAFPDVVKEMIDNGFRNLGVVPRVANSLFQGRFKSAGVETGRFLINSTFGIGGLFDIANQEFGLRPVRADFGQTLGVFDTPPGPFLVLPLLPPFTVRDAIGYGVDGAMNPLAYVIPFIWERLVMTIVDTVNSRALNLEVFQGIEETTLDLYTAVRNAYLARRTRLIEDAIAESFWKRQASP